MYKVEWISNVYIWFVFICVLQKDVPEGSQGSPPDKPEKPEKPEKTAPEKPEKPEKSSAATDDPQSSLVSCQRVKALDTVCSNKVIGHQLDSIKRETRKSLKGHCNPHKDVLNFKLNV